MATKMIAQRLYTREFAFCRSRLSEDYTWVAELIQVQARIFTTPLQM